MEHFRSEVRHILAYFAVTFLLFIEGIIAKDKDFSLDGFKNFEMIYFNFQKRTDIGFPDQNEHMGINCLKKKYNGLFVNLNTISWISITKKHYRESSVFPSTYIENSEFGLLTLNGFKLDMG